MGKHHASGLPGRLKIRVQEIPSSDVYEDFSEFYVLYLGDRLDDLPFYLDYAKSAQTAVVEIGAGSGRLTIPLAESGMAIVAVDISRPMLGILETRLAKRSAEIRQRVRIVEANACRGSRLDKMAKVEGKELRCLH